MHAWIRPVTPDDTMPSYRLRSEGDLLHRAIDRGIRPTGSAIAAAAGLSATTVNSLRGGRPPTAATMAALVVLFQCSPEDLFDVV